MRDRTTREEKAEEVEAKEAQGSDSLRDDEFYEAIPYGAAQDPALYDAAYGADQEASWLSSVLMLGGVWLVLAPYLLNYATSNASTNDILTGIAIGVLAAVGALATTRSRATSWLTLAAGVWLVVAPFGLGYTAEQTPFWNDIIIGAAVIALSVWRLSTRPGAEEI